jgi:hypothetical protein
MDNIFINNNNDDTSSSEEDYYNEPKTFMNMTRKEDYEKNRKRLFDRDIIRKNIVIDSHNYFQGDDGDGEKFNTSNFTVLFDLEDEPTESYQEKITTNYDIFKNVIGFRLLKTTIRTPPYNVNSTNNIIKYKRSGTVLKNGNPRDPEEILTITINPGVYTTEDIASVFQKFEGYYDQDEDTPESRTNITKKNAQFVSYSDPDAGLSGMSQTEIENITEEGKKWSPWLETGVDPGESIRSKPTPGITDNTFKIIFFETNYKSVNTRSQNYPYNGPIKSVNDKTSGVRFLFEFDSSQSLPADPPFKQIEEFTILWDYDSVTRGAARLFGFSPSKVTSSNRELLSNKMANFDSQYVDLVIPEIPSIACKKNSSGREIIERIQLKEGHGEYLHYKTPNDGNEQQYFNPMKIHRLTAQLWAVNNVLYDNDNSDVSYEFEITMVNNKKLLI